jgi:HD-GYP domain-containing protein (c-di-GMP phosphodiesterase class II)
MGAAARLGPSGVVTISSAVADTPGVSSVSESFDPALEEQLAAGREREHSRLVGREAFGRAVIVALFLVTAVPLAVFAETDRSAPWWSYVGFVLVYAVFSSIHIEVGSGIAVPTELVLVPMLFELPAQYVPLVVGAGLLAHALPPVARGRMPIWRAAVLPANALFSVAPACVMLAAGEPEATSVGAVVLAVALVAQFAADFAASSLHEWLALGVRPSALVRPMGFTFAIDALMAPVGYLVAVAASVEQGALLLPLPLVGLFALLARERRERLDSILELSAAYRGTAFLLGDVVEADDAYTGEHTRQVVDLVDAVARELSLTPRERRVAEFTAVVHDVGKIRIPKSIINKPGLLDADERAIIETHTVEGEKLLTRVGGLLEEVGHVVRSCHERWDGKGYPDGLSGREIPVVARLVCCCDAFNAMTTTRPYREAMSNEEALAEVRANSGSQFDPDVAAALIRVVERDA